MTIVAPATRTTAFGLFLLTAVFAAIVWSAVFSVAGRRFVVTSHVIVTPSAASANDLTAMTDTLTAAARNAASTDDVTVRIPAATVAAVSVPTRHDDAAARANAGANAVAATIRTAGAADVHVIPGIRMRADTTTYTGEIILWGLGCGLATAVILAAWRHRRRDQLPVPAVSRSRIPTTDVRGILARLVATRQDIAPVTTDTLPTPVGGTGTPAALTGILGRYEITSVAVALTIVSICAFLYYLHNGLGLAYNDARSHLDIGRRVVEGLNPGAAQLGSVWLPLTHILMTATVWNDTMWHTGLAGALWSMLAFVATGILVLLFLRELGVGLFGRLTGVVVFAANLNVLYLQSTAMTELMLLGTMTAGAYYLLRWYRTDAVLHLMQAAFWIMLSTLVRYDGWFLLGVATFLVALHVLRTKGWSAAEGMTIVFATAGGLGVVLWLLWNMLIFGDPLYFAFGPYSAHSQQQQLLAAGVLPTRHDWLLSTKIYFYALAYNSGAFTMALGFLGAAALWTDRRIAAARRMASVALLAPLLFNILALYLGHSVLYIQGLSGTSWFNVRYGVMMMPSFAIFIGYLVHRLRPLRATIAGLLVMMIFFQFTSSDAVTIDDARVGSSQKNVSEVSSWLATHAGAADGFILISAASHDSIIFSSGLPMRRFIHEGAGEYYEAAIADPQRWVRWIVVRTNADEDSTWRRLKDNPGFRDRYERVGIYPFADIYRLRDTDLPGLIAHPAATAR